jgi:hypothetical protein
MFPADATNGVTWAFRYNAGSASSYKWEFVGGSDLVATITGNESTTTVTTWVDLGTIGPRVVVPRAGDYDFIAGTQASHSLSAGGIQFGLAIGATTPSFSTSITNPGANYATAMPVLTGLFSGLSASAEVRMRYYNFNAGTCGFSQRWLRVRPVRVS